MTSGNVTIDKCADALNQTERAVFVFLFSAIVVIGVVMDVIYIYAMVKTRKHKNATRFEKLLVIQTMNDIGVCWLRDSFNSFSHRETEATLLSLIHI